MISSIGVFFKQRYVASHSLIKFVTWFALANTVLFWLIGAKYLYLIFSSQTLFVTTFFSYASFLGKSLVILITFCHYLGHLALLAFLPCLILIPIAYLLNSKKIIIPICLITWLCALILLISDILVFSMFNFHLNATLLTMIFKSEYPLIAFLELSAKEIGIIFAIIFILSAVEVILAFLIWHFIIIKKYGQRFVKIFFVLPVMLYISYFTFIISIANHNNVFAQQTPILPWYNQFIAILLPINNSFDLISRQSEARFAQPLNAVAKLHYPIKPLHYTEVEKPLNILMIVIDSWRYDALNAQLTPYLSQFAKESVQFTQHFSGGNSTQAGIFSLLYSLPSNYWQSIVEQQQVSAFIHMLKQYHYQTKILFSSEMTPPFHKTVFNGLTSLRKTHAAGETIPDRDRAITTEFQHFLTEKKSTPFFAFLFYDAAHGYYGVQNIPKIWPTKNGSGQRFLIVRDQSDKIEVINRYKNALHFIDTEIAKVIDTLKNQHLLDQTIIIVTSDHGEEFDDNHQSYLGHGSNYSKYQIQVPLIVHWPKINAQIISHQTNHYDILPTLMRKMLGVENAFADYSVGEDLFSLHHKPYFLVGSYINRAIIFNDEIMTLLTAGNITMTNKHLMPEKHAVINKKILAAALYDMRAYYQ